MGKINSIVSILGGRKLTASIFIFLGSVLLFYFNKLSEQDFIEILNAVFIIYISSNALQKTMVIKKPNIQNSDMKYPLGRKFILTIVVFIIVCILTGLDILAGESYKSIIMTIFSIHNIGNIASKIQQQE